MPVVKQRARDIGQHELTVPGGDASRNEQDPRIVRNLPGLAQGFDACAIHARGIEGGDVDLRVE